MFDTTTPLGELGIITTKGMEAFGKIVNNNIVSWRRNSRNHNGNLNNYKKENYIIDVDYVRFGSSEGKVILTQTVRGFDIYIICDVFNYGATYSMYGMNVPMGADEHYQDIKRIISSINGKARRITIIMPMLYEGRQHYRSSRESLDCAAALQELINVGVDNIITFDAHDGRVVNAIPANGFENVQPIYQMLKTLSTNVPDLEISRDKMMIISPDEGGMKRSIYFSSVLGLRLGMFYKQRDYAKVVNGRNPILSHEYIGDSVKDKDVIIVDDMISSGDSLVREDNDTDCGVAVQLKKMGARRIFVLCTFGLFTDGLDRFDEAYEKGYITKIFTTNGIYQTPELLTRPWYCSVDLSEYIACFIDTLNHDQSISPLLNQVDKIKNHLLEQGHIK